LDVIPYTGFCRAAIAFTCQNARASKLIIAMAIVILIALRMTSSIPSQRQLPEDDEHRLIGEALKDDMTVVT
jgi:hypothetical protein